MKYLVTLGLLLSIVFADGQSVIFHENFDLPSGADSITNGSTGGTNPALGATTTQLAVSPTQSFKIQGAQSSTQVYFYTQAFSTVNNPYVKLEFHQIAKLFPANNVEVQISTDNGQTWTDLNGNHYRGNDPVFSITGYFNQQSYITPDTSYWQATNNSATPTNGWWKKETFDLTGIASDTTAGSGSFTGYPSVQLRFLANFNFPAAGQGFLAGWFLDNIKVTASPCEFNAPTFDFDFQTQSCFPNLPQGLLYPKSGNSYPVRAIALDTFRLDAGIDSVALFYRINNGPWDSVKMPRQPNPPQEYKADITNVMSGDTVEYYIKAVDLGCPTTARSPQNGNFYQFSIIDNIPSICASNSCKGDQIISTFPWTEDFESPEFIAGLGNGNSGNTHRGEFPIDTAGSWQVLPLPSVSFGWSVRTGSTGTPYTGPSGDHTTGSGQYVYTEFSPYLPQASTLLSTPCIDLRDSIPRLFSFYYHMYGSEIQGLRVDVDTGVNSSAYWNAYLRINNPQQSSSSDPWKKGFVDLQPFKGKIIKLRFRVNRLVYGEDMNDVALDDMKIRNVAADDIELLSLENDLSNPCSPSSNVPLNIVLQNQGFNSISQFPLAYQLDNGNVVWDTVTGLNLNLSDTLNFTFSQSLSYSTGISHTLKIWTALANDTNQVNDTIQIQFTPSSTAINQFPHKLDFENATTSSGAGNLNNSFWQINTNNQGGFFKVKNGFDNNSPSGPFAGYGANGKFIELVDSASATTTAAELRSVCIDLSGLSNPEVSFQMYLTQNESIKLRVREIGSPWNVLSSINGTSTSKEDWVTYKEALSAYSNEIIELSFFVDQANTHFAIDNISIQESSSSDLAMVSVDNSFKNLKANSSLLPNANIHYSVIGNGGFGSSSKIVFEFTDLCNTSAPVITGQENFVTSSAGSGIIQTYQLQNLNLNNNLPAGKYALKVWLETNNDSAYFNDTIYTQSTVLKEETVPYFNDFENCNDDLHTAGLLRQWERTSPAGGAKSGNFSFDTNADTLLVTDGGEELLILPTFNGLDSVSGAELRFWHKFDLNGDPLSNFGRLEYLNAGQWEDLTQSSIYGNNWQSYMIAVANGSRYHFNGNSSGWIRSSYPINHIIDSTGKANIRFSTRSDDQNNSNWSIDDFEIYVPPQNSASPSQLVFLNGLPAINNNIAVEVYNSGRKSLDKVDIAIYDQNGTQLLQEQLSVSPAITWQNSRQINLQTSLTLNSSVQELLIVTSLPNNRTDALPNDDTLNVKVKLIQPINNLPYCVDFESGKEWQGFSNGILDTLWNYGTPSKSNIANAYSGTMAWITGDTGTYPALSNNYLYTPLFPVDSQSCYQLSFWHWYDTEYNFDGGNVEYSLDSGNTWSVLGEHGDTTWYNTSYVQALDAVDPGFSGSSGGWVEAWHKMKGLSSSMIQFRFRFGSGATIHGDGWAIDDVCFEAVGSKCETTGLGENAIDPIQLSLYPNPTQNELKLVIMTDNVSTEIKANTKIFDQTGKLIKSWEQQLVSGKEVSIDISELPVGIYSINLEYDQNQITQSFIKK